MSENMSDQIYSAWLEGSTKLDYYVVGIVIAVVGYWGKNLGPIQIASIGQILEILGFLFLLGAAYLGLRRIETTLSALLVNHERLLQGERAGALMNAAKEALQIFDQEKGIVLSREDALSEAARIKDKFKIIDSAFDSLAKRGLRLYSWRNYCLIGGLVLLLGSRLWPR